MLGFSGHVQSRRCAAVTAAGAPWLRSQGIEFVRKHTDEPLLRAIGLLAGITTE